VSGTALLCEICVAPSYAMISERTFLELIAMNVWQARRQGAIIGAAYVLGVGLLLYLIMDVGVLDPMSSFLYAGIAVMTFWLWQRVIRKP